MRCASAPTAVTLALLAALCGGCGARSMLGVGPAGEVDAAGLPSRDGGALPGGFADAGAVPVTPTAAPVLVYEPAQDPRRVLQGGHPHIAWAGSAAGLGRFALLFDENVRGRIYLRLVLVDAATLAVSETLPVTDESSEGRTPRAAELAWRADSLAVVWSDDDGALFFQRVEPDDRHVAPARRVLEPRGDLYVNGLRGTAEGFALALSRGALDERQFLLARLSPSGNLLAEPVAIPGPERRAPSWLSLVDLVPRGNTGFAVTFNERPSWTREAGHRPDRLFLSLVDGLGHAATEPALLYEAEDEIGGTAAARGDGFVVATWDLDRGIFTVPVDPGGNPGAAVALAAGVELERPQIAAAPNSLAMLALSGALRADNPMPTDVHFLSVDPRSGAVHSRVHLNPASSSRCALESKDLARQGDSAAFGVVWVEHCGERRMYFARAVAPL